MSAFHAAVGSVVLGLEVGMTMIGRTWPSPSGKHRARQVSDPSLLDDLLGPPSPYTTTFEHAPAPIKAALAYCPTCDRTTAGSLNKDGWLCGECLTPTTTTTTGDHR